MSERTPRWLLWAFIGTALGLALGALVGWWLWPVTYTNTSPATLRRDHLDEYVLMVAAAYEVEQDLEEARSRLQLVNASNPAAPVVDLAQRLVESSGREQDILELARLARDLGATDPSLTPYLDSRP
jgi:uncharacterized membrane protein YccC